MGERGPIPTPTRILEMRGSWRANRAKDEPQPEKTRPQCPRWLRKEAKRVWKELIPQLEAMRLLARCDRNALARYCQLLAMWREANEWVMKNGDVYPEKDATGKVIGLKEYPQVARLLRLSEVLLRLEKHFGLTPSSRAGLAGSVSGQSEPSNPRAERFFRRGI